MLIHRSRVLFAIILREMNARYGRSVGGYIWALLEPISFIVLFTVLFAVMTREPAIGRSFPLFFATGVVTFITYRDTAGLVSGAFSRNKPLFTYPKITLLDTVIASYLLQKLTLLGVAFIVFTGIFFIEDMRPQIDPGLVIAAFVLAGLMGIGAGMINCVLFPMLPTYKRVFDVLNRPLLLISGVFFTPERMPTEVREILLYNPIIHAVGLMRKGFYPIYHADYVNLPYLIATPLLLITVGLFLLRRYEGFLIEQ